MVLLKCLWKLGEYACKIWRGYYARHANCLVIFHVRNELKELCQGSQLYGDESEHEWMDTGREERSPGSCRLVEVTVGRALQCALRWQEYVFLNKINCVYDF